MVDTKHVPGTGEVGTTANYRTARIKSIPNDSHLTPIPLVGRVAKNIRVIAKTDDAFIYETLRSGSIYAYRRYKDDIWVCVLPSFTVDDEELNAFKESFIRRLAD